MLNKEEKRQLVKVSNLYYIDGWTQTQISKKIGASRPIISKQLNMAKEAGIVEVFIKDECVHTVELEQQLEKKYGLEEVVVAPTIGLTPEMVKRTVAQAGAHYISKNLKNVKYLGISWGTTIAELVKEYSSEQRKDIKIIPLEGGIGRQRIEIHANQLAYELAQKMDSTCSYLYAPAIVESEELKDRLMEMSDIKIVLEEGKNVDMAVIGIGNPLKESTLKKIGYLQNGDLDDLCAMGAVGDIGFRFFDKSGVPIRHPLNNKVIGLSLNQLKKIKKVIAVADGIHKLESIIGALRGNYVNVLIIDEQTASMILKQS
ncbi:sugar-binding transcriptional regulator [Metabacillus arenae]|uniref:Sugar-binding transcriptional regulator n=1 Tax=Metabacillus arenae TaxID=2771434 RepID=A0A926NPL6_9BACI|nr:sugar-binding transcriptional regulator [Metabacillus arenae]MBD1381747.1 sugar-binding transcriptional regulator [Metabacillus arenae]